MPIEIGSHATDIAGGVPFPFNQASFGPASAPTCRASRSRAPWPPRAGLPILFTPITLTSYRSNLHRLPRRALRRPIGVSTPPRLSRQTGPGPAMPTGQMDPERTKFTLHLLGWRYLGQSGAAVAVERAGSCLTTTTRPFVGSPRPQGGSS